MSNGIVSYNVHTHGFEVNLHSYSRLNFFWNFCGTSLCMSDACLKFPNQQSVKAPKATLTTENAVFFQV